MPLPIAPAQLHRRPYLQREVSAPAVLQRAAQDVYESFPAFHRRPAPITRRLGAAAREAVRDAEDRAEAGMWRLAVRAAWWWLGRCLRRC